VPRKKVKKSTTGTIEPNNKSYLDIDEVTRLEQVAGNLRDRLLIRLLSRLGCRISEELGM
jgi:integrase